MFMGHCVLGGCAEHKPFGTFMDSTNNCTEMVLRRLFSDRFFTSSFRPEFYSTLGVE